MSGEQKIISKGKDAENLKNNPIFISVIQEIKDDLLAKFHAIDTMVDPSCEFKLKQIKASFDAISRLQQQIDVKINDMIFAEKKSNDEKNQPKMANSYTVVN